MQTKTTTEMIQVMQAFVEGKPLQGRDRMGSEWADWIKPSWNWDSYEYRIKMEEVLYQLEGM